MAGKPSVASDQTKPLPECIVSIIVGQMLSGAAADTIYSRLRGAATAKGLPGTYFLTTEEMRAAGVSSFKARAITEFADAFASDPSRFAAWSALEYDELTKEVSSLWGLSEWSASILALSHFGMSDVWPSKDGSIQRAVVQVRANLDSDFDPDLGAPYRSYLARCLWIALDSRLI